VGAKPKWLSTLASGDLIAAFTAAGLNALFWKWQQAGAGGRGLPAEVCLCCGAALGDQSLPLHDWACFERLGCCDVGSPSSLLARVIPTALPARGVLPVPLASFFHM